MFYFRVNRQAMGKILTIGDTCSCSVSVKLYLDSDTKDPTEHDCTTMMEIPTIAGLTTRIGITCKMFYYTFFLLIRYRIKNSVILF